MKSYKDLPREVVLNAPEGAMFCRTRTAMSRNKISTRRLLWANAALIVCGSEIIKITKVGKVDSFCHCSQIG